MGSIFPRLLREMMSKGAQIDAAWLIRVKSALSCPGAPAPYHIVDRLIFGYRPAGQFRLRVRPCRLSSRLRGGPPRHLHRLLEPATFSPGLCDRCRCFRAISTDRPCQETDSEYGHSPCCAESLKVLHVHPPGSYHRIASDVPVGVPS
jgi:hypothetical protein